MYLFLDRGEGREKEQERNINVWLPLTRSPYKDLDCNPDWECALTGNQTGDPLVCRPVLNLLRHTIQGSAGSSEVRSLGKFSWVPC